MFCVVHFSRRSVPKMTDGRHDTFIKSVVAVCKDYRKDVMFIDEIIATLITEMSVLIQVTTLMMCQVVSVVSD
jgi:hypothetical protein